MMDKELPLTQHLAEIRKRIIYCLISITFFSFISYFNLDWFLERLTRPIGKLVFISPYEAFFVFLKLSLLGGVILSSPVIIYNICKFTWVALKKAEKKLFLLYGIAAFFLFLAGMLFFFFFIWPLAIDFLLSFKRDYLLPFISLDNYISFLIVFCICFIIVFELPLIMVFLTKIGIVNPDALSKKRGHALIAAFVIGAIFTPPDVVSQVLMSIPLYIFFEISLFFSKFIKKRK